jgi:hypothetical protein
MRPRTPSLDWIAKVLGESAEDRDRGRRRPVLRLVSGGAEVPASASPNPARLVGLGGRQSPQSPVQPRPKAGR